MFETHFIERTLWTLFILLSMSWGIILKRKLTYSQGYKESYDLLSHKSRNIIVSQVVIRKITINLNKFYKRIQLKYTHWRESWTNSQLVDHQKDLQVINNKLKWLSLAHLKFDKQYLLSSIALTDFFKKIFLWRKETECAPYFYDQRWNTKITFNWSFQSRNKKILPFNILFNYTVIKQQNIYSAFMMNKYLILIHIKILIVNAGYKLPLLN